MPVTSIDTNPEALIPSLLADFTAMVRRTATPTSTRQLKRLRGAPTYLRRSTRCTG